MLPAWLAAIVHVPVVASVTVLPATVHTLVLVELNAMASPEVALAETVNGAVPKVLPASAAKVMVWFPFAILNDWVTCAAAL